MFTLKEWQDYIADEIAHYGEDCVVYSNGFWHIHEFEKDARIHNMGLLQCLWEDFSWDLDELVADEIRRQIKELEQELKDDPEAEGSWWTTANWSLPPSWAEAAKGESA